MYRLVYVSTAVEGLENGDIETILNQSQSNNDERYITGFLAHNGRFFMQALEGERDEVVDIYGKIVEDKRHFGVAQIIGEPIEKRAFPDWSMNLSPGRRRGRIIDDGHPEGRISRRASQSRHAAGSSLSLLEIPADALVSLKQALTPAR